MKDIEKLIGQFISKDPSRPVRVEIFGELSEEMARRVKETVMEQGTEIDLSGNAEPQTVTIPLEAYAQMLRSHTQLETLRVAWHDSRGDLVWLLLRTMFGEEPSGDSDAK